ncbi:hypothetical protein [uncultured Parasutterella sp.]|uniref:hypothetical protein n=1 Tax=uncultured Parasutterella sp. TaxID=1263098 RepID=UPI00272D65D2|nr:hypothetical protein [uncultured Parasutterella sp.]
MKIKLTRRGMIPYDEYPNGSLFLIKLNDGFSEGNLKGRVLLVRLCRYDGFAGLTIPGIDFGHFYTGKYADENPPYSRWEPVEIVQPKP